MGKECYLCGKELTEDDKYQFFPEDDTYICEDCLKKAPEHKKYRASNNR